MAASSRDFSHVWIVAVFISWLVTTYAYDAFMEQQSLSWAFLVSLSLLLWSYLAALSTPPGTIPSEYVIGGDHRPATESTPLESLPMCLKCDRYKPRRAHHCSTCGQCILRYDHHCPWIAQCVGFYNLREFLLLTLFTTLAAATYTVELWPRIAEVYHEVRDHNTTFLAKLRYLNLVGSFLMALLLAVGMAYFGLSHLYQMTKNVTTLEKVISTTQDDAEIYNLGFRKNWVQACGDNPLLWCLPCPSQKGRTMDGTTFESV